MKTNAMNKVLPLIAAGALLFSSALMASNPALNRRPPHRPARASLPTHSSAGRTPLLLPLKAPVRSLCVPVAFRAP